MEVLSEHQRIEALTELDEDDSEGEESDDVCIATVQFFSIIIQVGLSTCSNINTQTSIFDVCVFSNKI